MVAKANGIFRGMTKIDSYSFKNEKGEEISVAEKFEIKFDEVDKESKILERVFKVKTEQKDLINKIAQLKNYQEVIFKFDVVITTFKGKQDIKLELVDIELDNQ